MRLYSFYANGLRNQVTHKFHDRAGMVLASQRGLCYLVSKFRGMRE